MRNSPAKSAAVMSALLVLMPAIEAAADQTLLRVQKALHALAVDPDSPAVLDLIDYRDKPRICSSAEMLVIEQAMDGVRERKDRVMRTVTRSMGRHTEAELHGFEPERMEELLDDMGEVEFYCSDREDGRTATGLRVKDQGVERNIMVVAPKFFGKPAKERMITVTHETTHMSGFRHRFKPKPPVREVPPTRDFSYFLDAMLEHTL